MLCWRCNKAQIMYRVMCDQASSAADTKQMFWRITAISNNGICVNCSFVFLTLWTAFKQSPTKKVNSLQKGLKFVLLAHRREWLPVVLPTKIRRSTHVLDSTPPAGEACRVLFGTRGGLKIPWMGGYSITGKNRRTHCTHTHTHTHTHSHTHCVLICFIIARMRRLMDVDKSAQLLLSCSGNSCIFVLPHCLHFILLNILYIIISVLAFLCLVLMVFSVSRTLTLASFFIYHLVNGKLQERTAISDGVCMRRLASPTDDSSDH